MKFILNFTVSKLLAYLILLIGTLYSFLFKDPDILIATFSAASAIITLKTYTSSRERIKQNEYNQTNFEEPKYPEEPKI